MKTYREFYQEGLLDVCQFLMIEMRAFLISEDRFKFRVTRFWDTMSEQSEKMNSQVNDEDMDFYGRVLYLMRKSIYSEYKYLRSKKLSPADCVITIIHRILDYSESLGEFRFSKEQKIFKEPIDFMWNNIRQGSKNLPLKHLTGQIVLSIENELRGALSFHKFDLSEIENPKLKKQKLTEETKFYKDTTETMEIKL